MARLKVGLALSGGTARSVAHIGVIKALHDHSITIDYLSGTSGGAIVAAVLAAGRSVQEIEELGCGVHWRDVAGLTIPHLGLLSSDRIRKFVVEAIGDVTFSDLRVPLAVVASDLTSGTRRVFTQGSVALACQASCSIPEFYVPVEVDGHVLVDGGFSEYVPVEALLGLGEMFAIGVNLGFDKWMKRKPRNFIEVTLQVANFIAQQNAAVSERRADFMIRPDLAGFGPFELDKTTDIMRRGYIDALDAIPRLEAALAAAGKAR
jgi:NTE family protein